MGDKMMLNKADRVLKGIEKAASTMGEDYLPIVGREKGGLLERLVKKFKPRNVLEIGTLVGYSCILIAKNMKKGKVVSIEVIKKNHEAAKVNIGQAGFAKKVELHLGDALKIIPALEGPFDFVFIDAKKSDYLKYLNAAEPLMTKNALVVADNAKRFAKEMSDYLEYVRRSGLYQSELHDFGADGVEVSKRMR